MTGLRASVRLDARVQRRYGLWSVAAVITAGWTALLFGLGSPAAPVLGPLVLVIDTASFGVFFVAALILYERTEGAFAALAVSPLGFTEYLATKVGSLAAVAVASALPVVWASTRAAPISPAAFGMTALAVALLAVLLLTLSVGMVLPHRSLTTFLVTGVWPLIPLLLAPLLHLTELVRHPLLFLVPTTAAAELIRLGFAPAEFSDPLTLAGLIAYLGLAAAAAVWFARRRWLADRSPGRGQGAAQEIAPPTTASIFLQPRPGRSAVAGLPAALARLDLATVGRDPLLAAILAGPVLLAIGLRFGYPFLEGFAAQTWGLDLVPHRPLLAVALIVLHVPYMAGSLTAMLILEDIDERHLLALRASPLSLAGYFAYRLGVAGLLALAGLLGATLLVDMDTLSWSVGMAGTLVLAAATAPLAALAVAVAASNRVEAISMLKIVGLVPIVVPVAAWFIDGPIRWALAPLPYFWVGEATWAAGTTGPGPVIAVGAGTLTTVLAGLLLGRRVTRKLGMP